VRKTRQGLTWSPTRCRNPAPRRAWDQRIRWPDPARIEAAIAGPFVGYEIGRRMGDRLFAARVLSRVQGGVGKATTVLRERGGAAVFLGRFVAILRALMPAAAGAAQVPYRTFSAYNIAGGLIWGLATACLATWQARPMR
jgi:membrane-associated protein